MQVAALGRFGAPFAHPFERGVVVHSLARGRVLGLRGCAPTGASSLAHSVWVDQDSSLGYSLLSFCGNSPGGEGRKLREVAAGNLLGAPEHVNA